MRTVSRSGRLALLGLFALTACRHRVVLAQRHAPDLGVAAAPSAPPSEPGWADVADGAPTYRVRATGDALWLTTADGRPLVNLLPALLVDHEPPARPDHPEARPLRETARPLTLLPPRKLPDGSWEVAATAQDDDAAYRYHLTAAPGDPRLRLRFEIEYLRPQRVRAEVLRFTTGEVGEARTVDRAYRVAPVRAPAFADALTPRQAFFGHDAALLGGPGTQGLWVRPEGRGFTADLEVDHEENHPLGLYARCLPKTGRPMKHYHFDAAPRRPGERAVLEATWVVGDAAPLRPSRYPSGFAAALVFTDHADQSDAAKLEAFAFGRTGALAHGETGAGFVNHGLTYTKSVFLEHVGDYAPQLDDPTYRTLVDTLQKDGVEIGVHSASGGPDTPGAVAGLLRSFREGHAGVTWIDHQPDTNCEAVANRGWDPDHNWYLLDVLADNGFRYLWSDIDLKLPQGSLNLLDPDVPGERRPVLYPHRGLAAHDHDFVLFASAWMFERRERFLDDFTDARLDALERDWGLHIGHVYLDTFRDRGRWRRNDLLEPDGGGYRLRPEVDALFGRLQARETAGDLWVTTLAALADHALAALAVETEYLPGGKVRVRSTVPLRGLTLLAPRDATVRVDGAAPPSRVRGDALAFWFDVDPDHPRTVEIGSAPPLRPANVTLEQSR
jgi:hypothetical protein